MIDIIQWVYEINVVLLYCKEYQGNNINNQDSHFGFYSNSSCFLWGKFKEKILFWYIKMKYNAFELKRIS